jgi:hypothetical protein
LATFLFETEDEDGERRKRAVDIIESLRADIHPKPGSELVALLARIGQFESARTMAVDAFGPDAYDSLKPIATEMARAGRLADALSLLEDPDLDKLIGTPARWAPSLERAGKGFALKALREAISVAAWMRLRLRRLAIC